MLGVQCEIYNGIKFYSVLIEADMLGHCLGEFSPTRKKPIPKKKKFK
jgi:ribosomal protein S19